MAWILDSDCPAASRIFCQLVPSSVWNSNIFYLVVTLLLQYITLHLHVAYMKLRYPQLINILTMKPAETYEKYRKTFGRIASTWPRIGLAYLCAPLVWSIFDPLATWTTQDSIDFEKSLAILLGIYLFDLINADHSANLVLHHFAAFWIIFYTSRARHYDHRDALVTRLLLPFIFPGAVVGDLINDVCMYVYYVSDLTQEMASRHDQLVLGSQLHTMLRLAEWGIMFAHALGNFEPLNDTLGWAFPWIGFALMGLAALQWRDTIYIRNYAEGLLNAQKNEVVYLRELALYRSSMEAKKKSVTSGDAGASKAGKGKGGKTKGGG